MFKYFIKFKVNFIRIFMGIGDWGLLYFKYFKKIGKKLNIKN